MSSPSSPISPPNDNETHANFAEIVPVEAVVSISSLDTEIENRLLRKLDLHVVIPLMCLFFLAFLDRVNVGNANIQGMAKELHMVGHDYNVALLVFFPP